MDADALLAATYRGDLRAFEALVRSQAGRLHRLASRVVVDDTLADDVIQETFLRVLRVPAAARPSRAAAAWLSRVTVRVALNILGGERARRRREERYAMERSEGMENGVPIGAALPDDMDRPIADALASLSPETRAALWLHVVEEERVREVAACLGSSRSTVSRRIQAGLQEMRARLAKSGIALAGIAPLRGALRGSESLPAEPLIRKILEAGRRAMASGAASSLAPDALDAALAAPVRSLRSFTWIGAAAIPAVAALAALGWVLFLGPGNERGGQPDRPLVAIPANSSPAALPSSAGRDLEALPTPATPPKEPPVVTGTVRDKNGAPIASVDVYLAMHPPSRDDMGQDAFLGRYFRADYYHRARFLQTKTDDGGRYAFSRVPEHGEAALCAFKEGYSGALGSANLQEGSRSEVNLVLDDGVTLTGEVSTADGSPITDAIVSVCQSWSSAEHVFRGAGFGPTDEDGRFQLGLGAGTTACHVRVSSDSQGQDFFIEVPVKDEGVALTLNDLARVKGTITWTGGAPAAGLTVRATGRLPEPPIPVERMGLRPTTVHDGLVGADGTYAIEGLHPELHYDIFVIDGSLGERQAAMQPLSDRSVNSFRLKDGEVKVWDHVVPRPILLWGRIRTENGSPLSRGHVGARKDGKPLNFIFAEANEEGFYELHLNTGPGEYLIHAEPPGNFPTSDPVNDLVAERFGKVLHLRGGEEVEVDLTIFEPAVLPLRVLDHAGAPLKNINAIFRVTFSDGRKMGHDSPHVLDDTGRIAFSLYFPAAEFWYEISGFGGGPVVETPRYVSRPGIVFEEKTIVLPRSADLRATLLDASGNALSERTISVHVAYEDGSRADFTGHTDRQGKFEEKGRVRATAFVLEIRLLSSRVVWKSSRIDGSAGGALDLGDVILDGEDP